MNLRRLRIPFVPLPDNPAPMRASLAIAAAAIVTYIITAQVGFRVALIAEQVTTVWAPTGIALATLLLGGLRLWPAIWIAAFLANAGMNAPWWTALAIATGNTIEAVSAAWVLRRLPRFDVSLRRVVDAIVFIAVASVATMVSATAGVTALCGAGVQSWTAFPELWFDWWLGDVLGAIIVAPAILTSVTRRWSPYDYAQASMFVSVTIVLTYLIFGQVLGVDAYFLEYAVFPIVIAAAVKGGPHVSSLAVLSASGVAIWHTLRNAGPFGGPNIHDSLVELQVFMGVLAGTAMLLAAAVSERESSDQRERESAHTLKRREQMLGESRDVLSLAMRGGSMGAWSRNLKTNEVWWSRELEELLGLEAGAFAGTEAGFFEFVHEEDRHAIREAVDTAVRDRRDYVIEFRFKHADGTWRWMEGRGRAVYAEDGSPQTLYGIGMDVTARKEAEIALRDAISAAESANQLKDQFLATLSHELRTPLTAILGYAQMLQTNSISPDKREKAIEVIERNAMAQRQLVEDLLDMSRITTGRLRLDTEPTPIGQILNEAVEAVRPAVDAKGIVFGHAFDATGPMVAADAARLRQVFWNLLSNAVKFTSPRGQVVVTTRRDGDYVEASVRDTGIGISPEFLPFVFEPFRQADARFARAHGGLGLGLAISKQLVELHGGTLSAFSAGPEEGATFTVRLPHADSMTREAREKT